MQGSRPRVAWAHSFKWTQLPLSSYFVRLVNTCTDLTLHRLALSVCMPWTKLIQSENLIAPIPRGGRSGIHCNQLPCTFFFISRCAAAATAAAAAAQLAGMPYLYPPHLQCLCCTMERVSCSTTTHPLLAPPFHISPNCPLHSIH